MMARVNLLLLDDHTLFRAMLSRLLNTESDFRVVAHCSSSQDDSQQRAPVNRAVPKRQHHN